MLEKPNLITYIPGRTEHITVSHKPAEESRVVALEDGAFRGNPTRVAGHPANPNAEMTQALGDQLREQAAVDVGLAIVGNEVDYKPNPNLITEVPRFNK